jgi:hypothetical protein
MKSLSQSEYGELRSLYEQVYTSTDEILVDDISEEVVEEIFNELVEEYISEGYETEEVLDVVEEAALDFIEAKVTYGHDTEAPKAPEKKSMLKGRIRYAKRKAGEAVKAGKLRILLRTKLREQDVLVSRQLQVPFRRRKSRSRRELEDSLVRVSVRQQVLLAALLLRHLAPLLDWVKKQ